MDYLDLSSDGYSGEASHDGDTSATLDESNWRDADSPASSFDMLSFLATALESTDDREKQTTLVFLSIHLGPWNVDSPKKVYSGTFFSVTLIARNSLLRRTAVDLDYFHSVPELIAIKTPKLHSNGNTSGNSKLLRSLAKEYQILKSKQLAKHKNIVTAYGCIWQTLPSPYTGHSQPTPSVGQPQPTPALVLDGTTLGDLLNFSRSRFLTLRERIWLCLDITSGLSAIHTHGVIHGDLKPNNILIFRSPGQRYTAKLADFGSAILLSETKFPCQVPPGTKIYRAPECADGSNRLDREGLVKTDLFSLGVTLAFLLIGNHLFDKIMGLSDSRVQSLKEENNLLPWIMAHQDNYSPHIPIAMDGDDDDDGWVTDLSWKHNSIFADDKLRFLYVWLCDMLLTADARQRVESVHLPMLTLRHMLRRHLILLHPSDRESTLSMCGSDDSASSWGRIASIVGISKARMRKLTGQNILPRVRISQDEIEAIAYRCEQPGSYLREARFIIEHNAGKRFGTKPQHWQRRQMRHAFSRPRPRPCILLRKKIKKLADKISRLVEESCVLFH